MSTKRCGLDHFLKAWYYREPMKTPKFIFILISFILAVAIPLFAQSREETGNIPKLMVFFSHSCQRCAEIKNDLMPKIREEFKGRLEIEYRDIADIKNYELLLGLQKKYNTRMTNSWPVFYFGGKFLNGEGDVSGNLRLLIAEALSTKASEEKQNNLPLVNLIEHFKTFKPLAISSAGLIDGINPCAFTVIVFFISFLTLQGYRKRELIFIGLSFIFAVFLTYLLLGLGLFGFLYRIRGFWLVVEIFNLSVGILSIILGVLCIYDIFKFKQTMKTEDMLLQLPGAVKNRIHRLIGLHYRADTRGPGENRPVLKLLSSALVTGFLVSILEAICTGQMYLPAIAFVLKTTPLKLEAAGLLVLYNLMFITPLGIIFLFALWGVGSEGFAMFLKRNLLSVKLLMAIMFFGLGLFLLWRA